MRTCTTMIYTDGKRHRYAVFRGRMIGRAFDLHGAEVLASYELGPGQAPDYPRMTAAHATKHAPAVYWQKLNTATETEV